MLQSTFISARHFYSLFDKSILIWDATYFSPIRFDGGLRQSFNFILHLLVLYMCKIKTVWLCYQSLTLMEKCAGSKLSKIGTHKLPLQFIKLSQVDKKVFALYRAIAFCFVCSRLIDSVVSARGIYTFISRGPTDIRKSNKIIFFRTS